MFDYHISGFGHTGGTDGVRVAMTFHRRRKAWVNEVGGKGFETHIRVRILSEVIRGRAKQDTE